MPAPYKFYRVILIHELAQTLPVCILTEDALVSFSQPVISVHFNHSVTDKKRRGDKHDEDDIKDD